MRVHLSSPGHLDRLASQLEAEEEKDEVAAPTPINLGDTFSPNSTTSPSLSEMAAAAAAASASIEGMTPPPPPTADPAPSKKRRAKKASPPGTTTARKKKKKKVDQDKMKIGCRVSVTRKGLYLCGRVSDEQKAAIKDFPQTYKCFGTVRSGKQKTGYNIEFDLFPAGQKIVLGLTRAKIIVLKAGAEEKALRDPTAEQLALLESDDETVASQPNKDGTTKKKPKKLTPAAKSVNDFVSMSVEDRATARIFEHRYGVGDRDLVEWEILPDGVHITGEHDPFKCPEELEMKKEIDFQKEALDEIFFRDFFPCIQGHAKLLDEFFDNPLAPYHTTVKEENIVFHQEGDIDPDWAVKQCYLLLIAAVTEAEQGVENLWKRGISGGRHNHADFGKYIPKNMFKAFCAGAAMVFAEKRWWYEDNRDKDWEIFMPVIESFNEKRRQLFLCVLLILDESMSGWRPKTSKEGGFPNISWEPRKPVPLGTMLRNCAECISGVMAFQDVVMNAERQQLKHYFFSDVEALTKETSSLPNKSDMSAPTAEVLRQAEGAQIKEGGWCGGDAWFGSVQSAVELKKRLGVYGTFVVKNNKQMFPMEALHSVMKARHGRYPAGHWVVMRSIISGVPLIAIVYAWSQKGLSYFISTCGKTTPSIHKYESKFEDEWGNTTFKLIPRPEIVHFLYEYCPLIDEHNKARQSLLALEKRWLTKNCWYRLMCTVVGMCVVDMYRLYRYHEIKIRGNDQATVDSLRIIKFTDMICGNLRMWQYKQRKRETHKDIVLERIRNDEGETNVKPTQKQMDNRNNSIGNPIQHSCFVCRRYLNQKGMSTPRKTSFWCKDCKMPLCDKSRVGQDGGRDLSCVDEHLYSDEAIFCCNNIHPKGTAVPKQCLIDLWPRRSRRNQV